MTPNNQQLPPGYLSIDEAVKLIKSDSRDNPVVDMDYLAAHVVWLDRNGPAHGFRIPKVRKLAPNEIYKTKRGKIIYEEHIGDANVFIMNAFENELLKKTILDKYREMTGREYQALSNRGVSTVADDAQGTNAVKPRSNKPLAKDGANIGEGGITTSNGDFAV